MWRGPWRGGWGCGYDGVPPAFEEWQRRAHAAQPTATCPFATLVANILAAVGTETNPEIKRKKIGAAFLAVENDVLAHLPRDAWLLGEGTIYPDTIESGGTRESALIKTHHNRVPSCSCGFFSAGCGSELRGLRVDCAPLAHREKQEPVTFQSVPTDIVTYK